MKKTILFSLLGCSMLAFAQNSVVSLAPLQGTGATATFTSVYRHTGGVDQNYLGYLLILPTPNIVWFTAKGSCLIEYNRISNGVRLIDNAGTGWLGGVEGVPVGPTGTTLSNAYCSVNTRNMTRTLSGTDMTVVTPVTFFGSLRGPMGTFLQTLDINGVWTGMTQFGNWTSTAITTPKPGPYIREITVPAYSVAGPAKVNVFTGHTAGQVYMWTVNVLVADSIVGGQWRCHVIYFGSTQQIQLVDDAGTGFTTNSPAQNGTCAIGSFNGELMYASGIGNEVNLNIPMLFNPAITSKLKVWVNTFDTTGSLTHWIAAP